MPKTISLKQSLLRPNFRNIELRELTVLVQESTVGGGDGYNDVKCQSVTSFDCKTD